MVLGAGTVQKLGNEIPRHISLIAIWPLNSNLRNLWVGGELAKAKAARVREDALFAAELERRLALPLDQWEPMGDASSVTASARSHLAARKQTP